MSKILRPKYLTKSDLNLQLCILKDNQTSFVSYSIYHFRMCDAWRFTWCQVVRGRWSLLINKHKYTNTSFNAVGEIIGSIIDIAINATHEWWHRQADGQKHYQSKYLTINIKCILTFKSACNYYTQTKSSFTIFQKC